MEYSSRERLNISCINARLSNVGLPLLFGVTLHYLTFSSSRMHIFKHLYLCTLASRGHYLVLFVLTIGYQVVLQRHILFAYHFNDEINYLGDKTFVIE